MKKKKRKTENSNDNINEEIDKALQTSSSSLPQKLNTTTFPPIPEWTNKRPFLNSTFFNCSTTSIDQDNNETMIQTNQKIKIISLPLKIQELILIEELLSCLMGFETDHIKCIKEPNSSISLYKFIFDSEKPRHPTLTHLINRILPLCTNYVNVNSYVEKNNMNYSNGIVVHSFCSSIGILIKRYLIIIAELENEFQKRELTLQKMLLKLEPLNKTFSILSRLCMNYNLRGCELIKLIQNNSVVLSGDSSMKKLFDFLLDKTSKPFFEMLELWVFKGIIKDPYEEFIIKVEKDIKQDSLMNEFNECFWDDKFSIRKNAVPIMFERYSDKILTTGKYLNVIRETEKTIQNDGNKESIIGDKYGQIQFLENEKLKYAERVHEYSMIFEKAFQYASKVSLDLIMKKYSLRQRLTSIKHYFLLDQGDFFVFFVDVAERELIKVVSDINITELQTLLEHTLRNTIAKDDQYAKNLTCYLLGCNLKDYLLQVDKIANRKKEKENEIGEKVSSGDDLMDISLTENKNLKGVEAFVLDIDVEFPVSLILNKKAITKYQLMFRHLFFCKYVERALGNSWIKLKFVKQLPNVTGQLNFIFSLQQKMIHFIHNFYYYMIEVVEKEFLKMMKEFENAKNIDDVMKLHNNYIDSCLKACLLSVDISLYIALSNILSSCLTFSAVLIQFVRNLRIGSISFGNREYREKLSQVIKVETSKIQFRNSIQKYGNDFEKSLKSLLNHLGGNIGETEELKGLIRVIKETCNTDRMQM